MGPTGHAQRWTLQPLRQAVPRKNGGVDVCAELDCLVNIPRRKESGSTTAIGHVSRPSTLMILPVSLSKYLMLPSPSSVPVSAW